MLVPCFPATPGTRLDATAYKTIGIVGSHTGSVWTGLVVQAFLGVAGVGNKTGFKQVASPDAQSFYVSGGGASAYGFRFVANASTGAAIAIGGQQGGGLGQRLRVHVQDHGVRRRQGR